MNNGAMRLLTLNGPGVRPCVDAANNWIGCSNCPLPCTMYPGGTKAYIAKYQPKAPEPEPVVESAPARKQNPWRVRRTPRAKKEASA